MLYNFKVGKLNFYKIILHHVKLFVVHLAQTLYLKIIMFLYTSHKKIYIEGIKYSHIQGSVENYENLENFYLQSLISIHYIISV